MICRIVPEDSMLTKIGAPEVKNGENNNNRKKTEGNNWTVGKILIY